MKKTGFTLVEMLVVIALIAVITTSISVAMFSMLENQKENVAEDLIETAESAACVYAEVYDLRSECSNQNDCEIIVTIEEDLIPSGYLDENEYSDGSVIITWDNVGLKTCTFQE